MKTVKFTLEFEIDSIHNSDVVDSIFNLQFLHLEKFPLLKIDELFISKASFSSKNPDHIEVSLLPNGKLEMIKN